MSRKLQTWKRSTEFPVPPDKRAKTDSNMPPQRQAQANDVGTGELWGDDDDMDVFTQDQLENIDNLIASSQQIGTGRPPDGAAANVQITCNTGRLVGHGSTKSRSMGEPWTSHVSSFSGPRNLIPNQAVGTRRNSASKSSCQNSHPKTAFQTARGNHISTVSEVSTPYKATMPPISSVSYQSGSVSVAPKGSTLKQQSFSPSAVDTGSGKVSQVLPSNEAQLDNKARQQIDKLLQDCEGYRKEMALLKENQRSNDGQVKILRASLTQKEAELSRVRLEQLRVVEQESQLRNDRESNLGKEIDKLKTQLQFKEQEIVEVQARCKRLEVNLGKVANNELEPGNSTPAESPRSKTVNPLSSPKGKVMGLSSARTSANITSPAKGAFPDEHSFLSNEKSPTARGIKQERTDECPIGSALPLRRRQKLALSMSSKGVAAGSLLVDRLISQSEAEPPGNASQGICLTSGLIDLMQTFQVTPQVRVLLYVSSDEGNSKTSNVAAIKHPTSDVGQTSNSDHLSLAKQALHELLSRSHPPASSIQNIPTYAHDDTQSALLFLPLIEDCVDTFTAAMGGKSESAFSSPAMSLVTNVSDSSVESSGGSLRSLSMAPPADRHTNTVLNALGVLNTLVNCSAHVRHAIVCHVTPLSTSTQKGKQGEPLCCHDDSVVDLDPCLGKFGDCLLFKKLIDLANPLHFQNRPCCVMVTEAALVCLTALAQNCGHQHLHRFESLISQDLLVNCLVDDLDLCVESRYVLAMRALDVLTALVRSSLLLSLLCVCADDCLLQLVYSCGCLDCKGQLSSKVVTLLSTIVSDHKNGVTLLLTPNCQCGADVIKSVVLILHRELQAYNTSPSARSLRLLRDGISLLHAFSTRDSYYRRHHQDVEHQYVELVCGTETLFRETGGIGDHEMAALLELWDFDQECPNGSGEEDDEENKALGPVTEDTKPPPRKDEQPMDVIEIE